MIILYTLYFIVALVSIVASILGFFSNQHWIFRASEFVRIQLSALLLITIVVGSLLHGQLPNNHWFVLMLMILLLVYHLFILAPYFPLGRNRPTEKDVGMTNSISVLSINVNQFNQKYSQLIKTIQRVNPDILLTMESNENWQEALKVVEKNYDYCKLIPLENTYGMHFYSNVKALNIEANYYMADDVPSIKVTLETKEGQPFTFYGIHPPPPSPTEESTSKERDGELMVIAKEARKSNVPVMVVGDFNNVAWSRSSKLFRKISGLVDVRIGRGFVSTFHANYKLLRFPIDLLFHSENIVILEFRTLEHVGSDHLPLYCRFMVTAKPQQTEVRKKSISVEEIKTANEMIKEGKQTQSDRPENVVK